MSNTDNAKCPVCGAEKQENMMLSKYACAVCGFDTAYIKHFAGALALDVWKKNTEARGVKLFSDMQENCSTKNAFTLSNQGVAYLSTDAGESFMLDQDGSKPFGDVAQFSASAKCVASLLKNGTVRCAGEIPNGGDDVASWKSIRYICAAPDCLYGVNAERNVIWMGSPCNQAVAEWKNVVKIAAGNYHVVGLTTTGTVLATGNAFDPNVGKEIEGWKNIKDIAAAGEYTVGLTCEGTVLVAGRNTNDERFKAQEWKNIRAIAVDSTYVYGLTDTGDILVAGACASAFLDMGRKNAAEWHNVVAISGIRSGIAALERTGVLHVAGNIPGKEKLMKEFADTKQATVSRALIRAAANV